ncbi:hypothetical protein EV363DRAFT_1294636 [Boletus edulis]|nr:hypothetical protein EV363DRAFT_1294636 [Boletus edulis]
MADYNHNFSDEDIAKLCELAPIANNPQHRPYVCLWVTNGGVCNLHFQASEFPEHLRSDHGVVGPEKAPFVCSWFGCFDEMQKESIIRHVNEQHLELRYECPICHEQFTRAHTVQKHVSERHQGS